MAPVVLSTDVHCRGCEKKIRKILEKVAGVEYVWSSFQTNEVQVDGSADAEVLRQRLATKLGRSVTIESYSRREDAPAPARRAPAPAPRAPTPPPSPPRYQPSSPPNYPPPPPPRSNDDYYYNPAPPPPAPPNNDGYYYPPSNDGYYNYTPPSNDGYYYHPYRSDGSLATFSDENPNACSVQ